MTDFTLTINNKEVYDFYERYSLDFERTNVMFLGIMNNLVTNMDTSLNTSVANKLLETVASLTAQMSAVDATIHTQQREMDVKLTQHTAGLSAQMSAIDTTIHKQQTELDAILRLKFADNRRDYADELKLILNSNNIEQIKPLIKESTEMVLFKTSAILAELVPQNHSALAEDINSKFTHLTSALAAETSKLFDSTLNKSDIDEFKTNIVQTISQVHGVLTTVITSSENRTDTKMNEIKQLFIDNSHSTSTLQSSVTEMLKKFEKGVGKGSVSEHVVHNILLNLYPCAQIDHVGNDVKESGDIILIRTNKPKILIENKDHDASNVPRIDVVKFIRDCTLQRCCGIMLAQNKGITNKENFEIQINDGNVLLFVHEVDFNVDKIKTAIEIVESFKMKLDEVVAKNDDYVIEKDVLDEINRDFSLYIAQKHSMLKLVKDFGDKIGSAILELKMPALEKYLGSRYATSNIQTENICKYCEKYIPKSMQQHYRYCSAKKGGVTAAEVTPVTNQTIEVAQSPTADEPN